MSAPAGLLTVLWELFFAAPASSFIIQSVMLLSAALPLLLHALDPAADPAATEILSDSDCPGGKAVQAELLRLMPDARGGLVKIERGEEGVELFLYSDQQSGPLRRLLPAQPSCDQLARLAATVIATWQATVQPPPVRPQPPPPVEAPRPAPGPRLFYEVSASVLGVLSGAQLTIAQQLDVRLSSSTQRFGVRLGVLLGAPHTLLLNPEQAEWTRWSLRVLPGFRLGRGRAQIELGAALALALVELRGQGYSLNRRSFGLDCGLGGGLRLGVWLGRVWPFFGLEVMRWLLPQAVRARRGSVVQEAEVPAQELLFSLGVLVGDHRSARAL